MCGLPKQEPLYTLYRINRSQAYGVSMLPQAPVQTKRFGEAVRAGTKCASRAPDEETAQQNQTMTTK